MKTMRRVKVLQQQDGAALVELALIMPLITLLLLGMINIGFLIQEEMRVADSARAGAEVAMIRSYAAINSSNSSFIQQVATNTAVGIPNYSVTVSNYCTCGPSTIGTVSCGTYNLCSSYGIPAQYVKVVATASLPVLFTVRGFPATYNVQSTAIARTPWTGVQY